MPSARDDLYQYVESRRKLKPKAEDEYAENNLAGLLMDSAAKAGSYQGHVADTSGMQKYVDRENQAIDKRYGIDPKVYQYLSDKDKNETEETRLSDTSQRADKKLAQERDLETMKDQREKERAAALKDYNERKLAAEVRANELRAQEIAAGKAQSRADKIDAHNRSREEKLADKAAAAATPKGQFEALPKENQNQIDVLSKAIADRTSISNLLESQLQAFQAAGNDETQRVKAGQAMLKTINSPLGRDAIGKEEADRLGSLLEYKMLNITKPGPFWGRDLDAFGEQVASQLGAVRQSMQLDKKEIDRLNNRQVGDHPYAVPVMKKKGEMDTAIAAPPPPGTIKVMNKDGDIHYIQPADLKNAEADGYTRQK